MIPLKVMKLKPKQFYFAVELGVVIGKGGRDITQQNADSHIAGYGAGKKNLASDDRVGPYL